MDNTNENIEEEIVENEPIEEIVQEEIEIDNTQYGFIKNKTLDIVGLKSQVDEKLYDHIVEFSNLDIDKINDGYYIIIDGENISYEKGERYTELHIDEFNNQLSIINEEFDNEISEYLSKYPKREQETFGEKKREAEKVLNGETSLYIETKSSALGITKEDFSNIIISKNEQWTILYTNIENEKDLKIVELKKKFLL